MNIVMYTRTPCPNCPRVLQFFRDNGVEPKVIDVTGDYEKVNYLKSRNHMSLPVVMVMDGSEIVDEWSGVNRSKMNEFVSG